MSTSTTFARRLLGGLALAGLSLAGLTAAPAVAAPPGVDYDPTTGGRAYGGTWFQFHNPAADPTQVIFANDEQGFSVLWDGNGVVSNIRWSPSGQHIAFLESFFDENVSAAVATYSTDQPGTRGKDTTMNYYENSVLHVLNKNGVEVFQEDYVRRFDWSPSGDQLAFITGSFAESGVGFAPDGVHLLMIKRANAYQIHTQALDLAYSPQDHSLYLYDPAHAQGPVVKYNQAQRGLVSTPHQGIYFSPDGTFYYAASYDGSGVRLFLTEEDREITREPGFLDNRDFTYSSPRYWLNDHQLVIDKDGTSGDWVLDVDSGEVLDPGAFVLGIDPSTKAGTDLRLLTGGVVSTVSQDSVPRSVPTRTSIQPQP